MLLFEVISAYYTRLQQPLISSQWDEVINAIQSLISELIYVSVNHAYHILCLGFHFRRLTNRLLNSLDAGYEAYFRDVTRIFQ